MQGMLADLITELSVTSPETETRYSRFFRGFRTTDLSFLPCRPNLDPAPLHAALVDGIYAIGGFGIAEGVGATMHLYMLTAFAKMPLVDPVLCERRAEFIDWVNRECLLIANTGSDDRHRSNNAGRSATVAIPVDGGYRVNGAKTFLSLAEVADLLLFTAEIPNRGLSFFVTPLKHPAIRIGPPHFDAAFPLHTYSVLFEDLLIPEAMALTVPEKDGAMTRVHAFQRALFQSLISAVYLGAAQRALVEAARFAREQRLADADGVRADLGRLVIRLHGALAASRICADPFAGFIEAPSEERLRRFGEAATVAKQTGCVTAAEIVMAAQRFIGTRTMEPGHVIAEISRLVQFGPLHPVVGALAERHFGEALLRLDR